MADEPFGGYSKDMVQTKISDFHKAMIEDYLHNHIDAEDIERELNRVGESEAQYWSQFRDKYKPFITEDGTGGPAFLARIGTVEHTIGVYYNLDRNQFEPVRLNPPPAEPPRPKAEERTLPEPQVPSGGRGRGDTQGKPSAVVRVARGIGRIFGIGRNKRK
ncbi:hypothetical protein [Rhodococcus phage P19]|nr:hypothetical protein [Rhodococcus phage P19]